MAVNVCIDINGNGVWKYEDKTQRYFRVQPNNEISGVIEGRFLPDPDLLWRKRCEIYDIAPNSEMGGKLKPQPATYALWQHWKEIDHADLHAEL